MLWYHSLSGAHTQQDLSTFGAHLAAFLTAFMHSTIYQCLLHVHCLFGLEQQWHIRQFSAALRGLHHAQIYTSTNDKDRVCLLNVVASSVCIVCCHQECPTSVLCSAHMTCQADAPQVGIFPS